MEARQNDAYQKQRYKSETEAEKTETDAANNLSGEKKQSQDTADSAEPIYPGSFLYPCDLLKRLLDSSMTPFPPADGETDCVQLTDEEKGCVQHALEVFQEPLWKWIPLKDKEGKERSYWAHMPSWYDASALLARIVALTSYDKILLSLPDGARRMRNLEKLILVVAEFTSRANFSANDLVDWIDSVKEAEEDESEAPLEDEKSNAVKLLTIHASKGLEFPVVFVPDMGRAVDSMSNRDKPIVFFDPDRGVAGKPTIKASDEMSERPRYDQLLEARKAQVLEESRRLFYVAATRAEKRLIMVGENPQPKKEPEKPKNEPKSINMFSLLLNSAISCDDKLSKLLDYTEDSMPAVSTDELPNRVENAVDEIAGGNENVTMPADSRSVDEASAVPGCSSTVNENSAISAFNPSGQTSISQWMTYRDCQRRYWYRQIVRFPEDADARVDPLTEDEAIASSVEEVELEPIHAEGVAEAGVDDTGASVDAAKLGLWVHAYLQDRVPEMSNTGLQLKPVNAETLDLPDWLKPHRKRVHDMIEAYNQALPKHADVTLLASWNELPFHIQVNEQVEFTGIIDRLDVIETPDGPSAVIVDYKTNRLYNRAEVSQKTAFYAVQLQAYAWVVSRLPVYQGKPLPVVRAELQFLDWGEVRTVPVDVASQEKAIADMARDMPALLGFAPASAYKRKWGEKVCKQCAYYDICKAWFLENG